jgi:hypothetical protein
VLLLLFNGCYIQRVESHVLCDWRQPRKLLCSGCRGAWLLPALAEAGGCTTGIQLCTNASPPTPTPTPTLTPTPTPTQVSYASYDEQRLVETTIKATFASLPLDYWIGLNYVPYRWYWADGSGHAGNGAASSLAEPTPYAHWWVQPHTSSAATQHMDIAAKACVPPRSFEPLP